MCFFLKMLWFSWTLPVLLQRWCSTCHLAPQAWSVHTHREKSESGKYLRILKNTIFNEHSVGRIEKFPKTAFFPSKVSIPRGCRFCPLLGCPNVFPDARPEAVLHFSKYKKKLPMTNLIRKDTPVTGHWTVVSDYWFLDKVARCLK